MSLLTREPVHLSGRRLVLLALIVYAATRVVSTTVLAAAWARQVPYDPWTGGDGEVSFLDMSVLWDGSWYRIAAEQGYPAELPLDEHGRVRQNSWAFYPAFPALARMLMVVPGVEFPLAGTVVALIAGAGAAVLMVRLFARFTPVPVALAAMAVWGLQPAAPSLQVAYSESLAMLVLVAVLTALIDRRWWLVAILALVLGVTRPIAVPLAMVVGIAFLREAWTWWQREPRDLVRLGPPLAATAVTGLSGLIWPTVAGLATGVPTAYTETMAAWRAGHEIVPLRPWIDNTAWLLFRDTANPRLYAVLAVLALVAFLIVAAAGPWARRLPMELRVWIVAYPAYLLVVLDVGTSLIRYAVPLFPLALILIGGGLRTIPRWWPWAAGALGVLFVYLQYVWTIGLYLFIPPSGFPP